MSVSRRLARDVARCLDAFARPCATTTVGRASTSAVTPARWNEAATRVMGGQFGFISGNRATTTTTTGSTRAFVTSATPTRRRVVGASTRGRDGKSTAAATPVKGDDSGGRRSKASDESTTRAEATTETMTPRQDLTIRYRTHLVKKVLEIKPGFDEVWGATMRERWRFTYPAPTCFSGLYAYKFTVLAGFVIRSSWFFVPYLLAAYTPVWLASVMVSGMGLVGFLLVAKAVGLGEPAFEIMNYANSMGDYVGAENLMLNLCAALVTIRTSYYTLPVVLFVWEEIVYNLRRARRLARWIR